MAQVRGFQGVLNGNANGAGIVLPDSQTENYAMEEIAKNGLLAQRQAQQAAQQAAQTNKDFATNQLKIDPSIQYRNELNGLSQKWFDKGVGFRKQGFDPFSPDYNKPDQVAASQQYLSEKKHIEDLAALSKEVDANYNSNQKESQDGKLAGFDDYQAALKNTSLQDLYKKGGINALPQLYKPYDTHAVDEQVALKPQTRETSQQVAGAPAGVMENTTEKYVNMPQAARSVESAMLNQPGINQHLKSLGVDNVKNLYTLGGHNIKTDANNPEEFGHIDEPGIYHQIATDYLSKPELIKQLPDSVKQNILKSANNNFTGFGQSFGIDNGQAAKSMLAKPYDASEDPDFKKFIDDKFDGQIKQERAYQGEIMNGISRKVAGMDLGSTSKTDATMANLALRQQTVQQGWQRNAYLKQGNDRANAQWQQKLNDQGTRENWIKDIQNSHPDAVASLASAVKEVRGTVTPTKTGIQVTIPETVPNYVIDHKTGKATDMIDPVNPKKEVPHVYKIDKYSGRPGRIQIEQVLNKLPTFGKEKGLKTEPYSPAYNNIGGNDNADDL